MKERKSNLELLRIISMCGIIVMHYFGMGGAVQNNVFPHFSWFFVHFLNSFCIPLVNCFVLISGYFLITRNVFCLKKPVGILVITAIYGLVSYVIYLNVGHDTLSLDGIVKAMFPFIDGKRWFVETYIILILVAPFLNKLLCSLKRNHYRLLLVIQILIFSVWYSVGLSAPLLDDGYGIINFLTLYMIGGYIRLFYAESRASAINRIENAVIYIICGMTTFVLSYFINPYGYAFITNIIGSVAVFLLFLKWDMGSNKTVNCISKATFDVYFVHSDTNTSRLLIYELLGAKYVSDTPMMIPHMILAILAIWILGFVSYNIRKKLFSITVDGWLNKIKFISRKEEI